MHIYYTIIKKKQEKDREKEEQTQRDTAKLLQHKLKKALLEGAAMAASVKIAQVGTSLQEATSAPQNKRRFFPRERRTRQSMDNRRSVLDLAFFGVSYPVFLLLTSCFFTMCCILFLLVLGLLALDSGHFTTAVEC